MTSRIKIVGVQFAANPDHEPETPMTAQESQRTIDLLTQLDRTHPRVTIKPEPTNAADKEALAVRLMSRVSRAAMQEAGAFFDSFYARASSATSMRWTGSS